MLALGIRVMNFSGDTGNVNHGAHTSALPDLSRLPRIKGGEFGMCHMQKRRGRIRMVRRRKGVNRHGVTPDTTQAAGGTACSGHDPPVSPALPHDPFRRSVCEVHDPTGEPDAGNPPAVSKSGDEKTWPRCGLGHRHRAKAAGKQQLPTPNARCASPRPYYTYSPASPYHLIVALRKMVRPRSESNDLSWPS